MRELVVVPGLEVSREEFNRAEAALDEAMFVD
jgi:hypothetical protein